MKIALPIFVVVALFLKSKHSCLNLIFKQYDLAKKESFTLVATI